MLKNSIKNIKSNVKKIMNQMDMDTMKKSICSLSFLFLLTSNIQAAVVYNFANLVDTNQGEISGVLADGVTFPLGNPGEQAFQSFSWGKESITLTASASYNGVGTYDSSYPGAYEAGDNYTAWIYLDEITTTGHVGTMGVCHEGLKYKQGVGNQCDPNVDDKVSYNEVMQLDFDQPVVIDFDRSVFRGLLEAVINPEIEVSYDQGLTWGFMDTSSQISGDSFYFRVNEAYATERFVIEKLTVATVPVPAAAWLLGSAMIGLVGIKRSRSRL